MISKSISVALGKWFLKRKEEEKRWARNGYLYFFGQESKIAQSLLPALIIVARYHCGVHL
jgi:hypothetical protein